MQSCNLTPPRLVGCVPVCACFSATCVNSECKMVLLSPSVPSDRLRSIEKASPPPPLQRARGVEHQHEASKRAHTEFFLRFAMKAAKPSDAPTIKMRFPVFFREICGKGGGYFSILAVHVSGDSSSPRSRLVR